VAGALPSLVTSDSKRKFSNTAFSATSVALVKARTSAADDRLDGSHELLRGGGLVRESRLAYALVIAHAGDSRSAGERSVSQRGCSKRHEGMTHTSLTSTTATPLDDARTPQTQQKSFAEMLEELIDLSAGLGVALLPVLLLAVPGIILFVVLPAILLLALAAPLAAIGAVIAAPPYLLAHWLRRRRRRTASPPADLADSALRSVRRSGQSRVRDLGLG
jgi:hypothetical protein